MFKKNPTLFQAKKRNKGTKEDLSLEEHRKLSILTLTASEPIQFTPTTDRKQSTFHELQHQLRKKQERKKLTKSKLGKSDWSISGDSDNSKTCKRFQDTHTLQSQSESENQETKSIIFQSSSNSDSNSDSENESYKHSEPLISEELENDDFDLEKQKTQKKKHKPIIEHENPDKHKKSSEKLRISPNPLLSKKSQKYLTHENSNSSSKSLDITHKNKNVLNLDTGNNGNPLQMKKKTKKRFSLSSQLSISGSEDHFDDSPNTNSNSKRIKAKNSGRKTGRHLDKMKQLLKKPKESPQISTIEIKESEFDQKKNYNNLFDFVSKNPLDLNRGIRRKSETPLLPSEPNCSSIRTSSFPNFEQTITKFAAEIQKLNQGFAILNKELVQFAQDNIYSLKNLGKQFIFLYQKVDHLEKKMERRTTGNKSKFLQIF